MERTKSRPEEIVAKRRESDVLLTRRGKVRAIMKAVGVHQVTHYRCRKEYGGLKVT